MVLDDDPVALSDGYLGGVLANDACWVIAAFEGDEPVGYITGHELAMTRHERTERFVYDLAVRADRQRRGIGRRLVDAPVAGAAAHGVGVLFVLADDEDVDAIAFYEDSEADRPPSPCSTSAPTDGRARRLGAHGRPQARGPALAHRAVTTLERVESVAAVSNVAGAVRTTRGPGRP